jgi:hypothetical protein
MVNCLKKSTPDLGWMVHLMDTHHRQMTIGLQLLEDGREVKGHFSLKKDK